MAALGGAALPAGWDEAPSVAARLRAVAARHRGRLALDDGRLRLSYEALDREVDRIAALLSARGLGRGARVATLLRRDGAQVAAFLAILRAGGVAVALDPAWPEALLARVLDDAAPAALLTQGELAPRSAAAARGRIPLVEPWAADTGGGGAPRAPGGAAAWAPSPEAAIAPEDAACIVYTAGSTGAPKGVLRSHRCVLHQAAVYAGAFKLGPDDRVSIFSSMAVASGVSAAHVALLHGASLHPFDLDVRPLGEVAPWLARQGVTVWISAASIFRAFAAGLDGSEDLSRVRLVKLGAEPIRPRDLELWRRRFPPAGRFALALSSSETGVMTLRLFDGAEVDRGAVALAGYPAPDKRILLVDEGGAEVPMGAAGRIVVRSPYLSPGYWARPELDAAAFPGAGARAAADDAARGPQHALPVERACLTADLGRRLPDGAIEHLGRCDARVKVRGQSVDLDAVEAALTAHPAVAQAVVQALEDGEGRVRLAAHLVGATAERPTDAALRLHLRGALPAAHAPGRFLWYEALPLTANGKADRARLRAALERAPPPAGPSAPQHPTPAPQDPTSARLAELFCQLLEVDEVDDDDDFFALGGDSLLAVSLLAALRRELGASLQPADLLGAPTPALLAARLRAQPGGRSGLVELRRGGARPPLFLFHDLLGDLTSYRDLVRHLPADLPLLGIEAVGLGGAGARLQRVEDMAAHHGALIARRQPAGPLHLAGHSLGGLLAHATARELTARGRAVAFLGLIDSAPSHRPGGLRYPLRRALAFLSRAPRHVADLRRLPPEERLRYLRERARPPGGAARRYDAQPYAGPVTLFRADERSIFERDEPRNGWRAPAAADLEIHPIPGDHLSLMREPHVRALARRLELCLRRCQPEAAPRG